MLAHAVRPGDCLARGTHVGGNLQKEMLACAVGLGSGVDDLDDGPGVGTTALRARLLPSPHNKECLALLRDYVAIRLEMTQRIPLPADSIARSNVVQEKLWQQAKAVASKDSAMVPTGLFISTR
jgi:hypothetical protein